VDPSLQTAAIEIQKILYPLSLSLVSRDSMWELISEKL
jgi:hypothetical protein